MPMTTGELGEGYPNGGPQYSAIKLHPSATHEGATANRSKNADPRVPTGSHRGNAAITSLPSAVLPMRL